MKFAPLAYYISGYFEAAGIISVRLVRGYAVQPDTPVPLRLCVRRTGAPNRWVVDHWDTGWLVPVGTHFSRAAAVRTATAQINEQQGLLMRQLRRAGARRAIALVRAVRGAP